MRAFSASSDQTRPTITLHGTVLSISPAGMDPHGQWGIHVEPPVDGRAQELRVQLELAARRLAGSKGNPPRLQDEIPAFEAKATNLWAPGTPPEIASDGGKTVFGHSGQDYYEPASVGRPTDSKAIPSAASASAAPAAARPAAPGAAAKAKLRQTPPFWSQQQSASKTATAKKTSASNNKNKSTRIGRKTARFSGAMPVQKPAKSLVGRKTESGFANPAAASSQATQSSETFARTVGYTMPLGFSLEEHERVILNALGNQDQLTATEVAALIGVSDPIQWMEKLMCKLGEHGLEVVSPGDPLGDEPTYQLRR